MTLNTRWLHLGELWHWITRTLRDGRIVVELVALPCRTYVAIELFPGAGYAPSYGLLAIGSERTVVSWLRAAEA